MTAPTGAYVEARRQLEGPLAGSPVGLDLSLAATGIAWVDDQGEGQLKLVESKGREGATWADRSVRRRDLRKRIVAGVMGEGMGPSVVLLEGPSYNSKDPYLWDRAGLWCQVYDELSWQVPLCIVAPATLKMYATGNGNASKALVVEEARHRFGHVWAKGFRGNDNLADAAVLCAIGHHGWAGKPLAQLPQKNVTALDGVQWPEVP